MQLMALTSKIDNHLKQGNMNYLMRRSSAIGIAGPVAPIDPKNQYRTATQIFNPQRGGSLYKKAQIEGVVQRKQSMSKMGSFGKPDSFLAAGLMSNTLGN